MKGTKLGDQKVTERAQTVSLRKGIWCSTAAGGDGVQPLRTQGLPRVGPSAQEGRVGAGRGR